MKCLRYKAVFDPANARSDVRSLHLLHTSFDFIHLGQTLRLDNVRIAASKRFFLLDLPLKMDNIMPTPKACQECFNCKFLIRIEDFTFADGYTEMYLCKHKKICNPLGNGMPITMIRNRPCPYFKSPNWFMRLLSW